MKAKLSILLLFLAASFLASAQEKTTKGLKQERELEKQKGIKALLDSLDFVFEAQKVTPQGGRLIQLDYNTYFLNFNTDKTTCDLPFFGRAFNVGYNGDGGIKFEGKPEDIKIEKKKKNTILRATVKGENDVYDLTFTIFFNGSTSLNINSNDRASIYYDGVISASKKVEVK